MTAEPGIASGVGRVLRTRGWPLASRTRARWVWGREGEDILGGDVVVVRGLEVGVVVMVGLEKGVMFEVDVEVGDELNLSFGRRLRRARRCLVIDFEAL